MIRIEKDKNLLKIYVEGTQGFYSIDINTATVYGKKGAPLKQFPSIDCLNHALCEHKTNLCSLIYKMKTYVGVATYKYRGWASALRAADKMDGMGIPNLKLDRVNYENVEKLFPQFTKYVKQSREKNETFNNEWFYAFSAWLTMEEERANLGANIELLTTEMIGTVKSRFNRSLLKEEWDTVCYYLVRGKMWEFFGGHTASNHLCNYFSMCNSLNKEPQKVNNFIREYIETKREYELRKTELDAKAMKASYDLHRKAFEFTFGEYSVIIPKTPKDIIDEGSNMHHCVASYAQGVIEGRTYILFVRKTNTPDTCYITCEVRDGAIRQYYLAYDKHISTNEDIAFREAFAKHLAENW